MKLFLAVLLIAVLLLAGCAKEIVIPSSLSPYDVVKEIYPENPLPYLTEENYYYEHGASEVAEGACEEGFVGGYYEPFIELWYTKIDGTTLNQSSSYLVLIFSILKYENAELAERSYDGIAKACDLQSYSYKGIAVKAGAKPASKYGGESMWGISNLSLYVVHLGCFIIYVEGRDDIAQDALDWTIATFGVKSSSNQTRVENTT